MIITGKSVRNIKAHLSVVPDKTTIIIGIPATPVNQTILVKMGFTDQLEAGETVLPSSFGPVTGFNANGKLVVHKDQPMETAYRMVKWHWKEWCGRGATVEKSDFREVPYRRYPRTLVPPPSVELHVSLNTAGSKIITAKKISYTARNLKQIKHIVNLFLELFQECHVFTGKLKTIIQAKVIRLNWRVLPHGRYPWEKLKSEIDPFIKKVKGGNQPVVSNRLETINKYNPELFAFGQAGFYGYVIMGFPAKHLFLCESIFTGNATYVFGDNWQNLSRMTKAQILNGSLQKARIIHRKSWFLEIKRLLS